LIQERAQEAFNDAPASKPSFTESLSKSYQSFSKNWTDRSAAKALGKEVNVEVTGQDRYGRTVADVILPDGTTLNEKPSRLLSRWLIRLNQ
jgi:endonuclease YncB( thermonuclease family)